ncbi:MAG: outer membrane protein assembly factor BamA, partial [Sedimentitalea sp.]|nr:outer membrane protein assembly factor BamA [Sedimentitalea sp.]
MYRLLVALILSGAALTGLPPRPAMAQTYQFTAVEVEGNRRVETASIVSYAGLERGVPVSAGQLNDAYQRIFNSGLFETVELTPRGNTLVITVSELPTINRV